MKKKILVTGSEGFLGKNFCENYNKNYNFIKYDKKINGDLSSKKFFPTVDIVLHLAAFNSTEDFYNKPLEVIYDNLIPTINLIKFYSKIKKKPLFVFTGTPEIASGAVELFNYKIPTDEKVPSVIPDLLNSRWSYAGSKSISEQIVIHSKLNYIIVRPHNVYGPRQINHFIPEFISRSKKQNINLYGWKNKRCWLYVDDFCNALHNIMNSKNCVNQIINVGSNFEHSVYEVSKEIINIWYPGKKKYILKKNAPLGSVNRRVPDIRKLKKLTGWRPTINLKKGLKKLFDYENK